MIITEGVTTPQVATIPPKIPCKLYPMKVATFTAIIPGVICPMA